MYRFDDAFKNHEKFFFIIQQYEQYKNDLWLKNHISLNINKELLNPYYAEGEEISKRKLSNFILEGLEEILERIKESSNIILHPNHISNMILFRTGYGYNFEIDYNQCLIYLPQTNQIFYGSKNGIDKNIFISQAYVLVIEVPLAGIEPATHGLEVHRSVH